MEQKMRQDIKSGPGSIIMLQEAEPALLAHLIAATIPGEANDGDEDGNERHERQYIGFRGPERGKSLLICGRTSLVKGMRMLLFRLRPDGTYKKKSKGKRAVSYTHLTLPTT